VIRTLGLNRADLLGWSDGAIVASSFAARFPSMTSAVALLSLPGRFRGSLRAGARLVASLPLERLPMGGGIVSAALAGLCRGPMIRAHQLRSQMRAIPDFIHVFKYSLIPLLLDHAVAPNTISAATLVVVGDRDRLVSVKEARELAARLPRACGPVVIPSGEHFLTYANAAAVNGHLRSFFAPDD
jgi:pimeloyl-ACP methyl ester carboxylesterase